MKRLNIILSFVLLVVFAGCVSCTSIVNNQSQGDFASSIKAASESLSITPVELQDATNLQILTPPLINRIGFAVYSEGVFCIYEDVYYRGGEKYRFLRIDGEQVTDYSFDYAYPFSEGLACVRIDGKYGFIDSNGDIVLPFVYDNATPFIEGLAYFEIDETYGFIDRNGNIAFLLDCDSISSFQEGLAFFFIDGKYGYIDTSGSVVIAPMFDDAGFFEGSLAKVRVGYTYGFIDKKGAFVVAPIYEDITVDGDYFLIKSNGMYGVLDSRGAVLVAAEYSYLKLLPGNDAAISKADGRTTIIGFNGAIQTYEVDIIYPDSNKSDMIRAVSPDKKIGFINASNHSLSIPCIYDAADDFIGEYAKVLLGGDCGIIDKQGNIVLPFDSNWKKVFPNGTFAVMSEGKYLLIDCNGEPLNDILFDDIQQVGEAYMVRLDYKTRFLETNGKELHSPALDCWNEQVFRMDNCFIEKNHSIVVFGELQETDLTDLLLTNVITPRIKPFSQFAKENRQGIRPSDFYSTKYQYQDRTVDSNNLAQFYKLYCFGTGSPILYYYARPLQQMGSFPLSYSGFYSVKDEQLNILVSGYECGGSAGGDSICFWQDTQTLEIYIGTYYHRGGFGGYSNGGHAFRVENGDVIPVMSIGYINQTARNYPESVLLENASLFYGSDDVPYTETTIQQVIDSGQAIVEYSVDGELTTIEKYREEKDKYPMLRLWRWSGY